MKKIYKTLLLVFVLMASACDLDQLDNPNNLSPSQSDPNFVLNAIQLGVRDTFITLSENGMANTRILALTGGSTYATAFAATSFDDVWTNAYSSVLINSKILIEQAAEKQLYFHSAVTKILQAYTLVSLVDTFGNVPYSEALDPSNFNPSPDNGSDVYAASLAMLDDAISDIGKITASTPTLTSDLFYGASKAKWTALANTLKLKIYLQTRLVNAATSKSQINALLGKDLIDTEEEDFVFNYPANSISAPDTRHPWYADNYTNGAGVYIGNSYIYKMIQRNDPRIRYYFYRQTTVDVTDVNASPCINQNFPAWYSASDVYCQPGNGYLGRDHLNNDGTPPDNKLRTDYGVYPAGGRFDADDGEAVTLGDGAKGVGILPIMLSSYVDFMKAEAALELGTSGDPKALMLSGVAKSLDKVASFGSRDQDWADIEADFGMTETDIDNYLALAEADYDNSTDKMDVIGHEYWYSLFGNGVEAYNLYRRTGKPANMQPAYKIANPGSFIRSYYYPSVFVNRNSSTSQKVVSDQVFWDTNPAGFIH
jgi:hypothetical protein